MSIINATRVNIISWEKKEGLKTHRSYCFTFFLIQSLLVLYSHSPQIEMTLRYNLCQQHYLPRRKSFDPPVLSTSQMVCYYGTSTFYRLYGTICAYGSLHVTAELSKILSTLQTMCAYGTIHTCIKFLYILLTIFKLILFICIYICIHSFCNLCMGSTLSLKEKQMKRNFSYCQSIYGHFQMLRQTSYQVRIHSPLQHVSSANP